MRHSSISLTMKYYTHLRVDDLRGGLAALPPLPNVATSRQDAQETGTDTAALENDGSGICSTLTLADDRRRVRAPGKVAHPLRGFPISSLAVAHTTKTAAICSRQSAPTTASCAQWTRL